MTREHLEILKVNSQNYPTSRKRDIVDNMTPKNDNFLVTFNPLKNIFGSIDIKLLMQMNNSLALYHMISK